ncbi:MAG: hypothetical protein IK079_06340 [Desulfovibrio sp.]|nr:hypothetical protein [Desulfovibrio sp.]
MAVIDFTYDMWIQSRSHFVDREPWMDKAKVRFFSSQKNWLQLLALSSIKEAKSVFRSLLAETAFFLDDPPSSGHSLLKLLGHSSSGFFSHLGSMTRPPS